MEAVVPGGDLGAASPAAIAPVDPEQPPVGHQHGKAPVAGRLELIFVAAGADLASNPLDAPGAALRSRDIDIGLTKAAGSVRAEIEPAAAAEPRKPFLA